jgi:hypothetical protein
MTLNSLNSLKGEYIFYKDGIEVARSKNIVTNNGKEQIINYLSRQNSEYGSRIVLGCGSSTPLATDEFVQFEVFPTPVQFKTVDYTQTPTQIVFRTTLPSTFKGVVYESGLSTIGGVNMSVLNDINDNPEIFASFDPDYESWELSTGVSIHANDLEGTPRLRVGDSGLEFIVPASSTKQSTWYNATPLGYLISSDKIKIAFHVSGSVPNSVGVKMAVDSLNYFQYTIPSASIALGYNIVTINVAQLSRVGDPNIENTQELTVTVSSGASASTVTMDAMRFDQYSSVDKAILVSRSILTTPLVVEGGVPFDIEYRLGFDI